MNNKKLKHPKDLEFTPYVLLQLVREHKKVCKHESCDIALFAMFPLFTSLVGKEMAKQYWEEFI